MRAYFVAPANILCLAAFMSPAGVKSSSMDNYGNVKIPYIHKLRENISSTSDEWLEVDSHNLVMADYSAQLGIPVVGQSTLENSTFNMETSYWTLNCPVIVGRTNRLSNNSGNYADGIAFGLASNTSRQGPKGNRKIYRNALVTNANESMIDLDPRQILYCGNEEYNATYAECYLRTVYVEVSVSCIAPGNNCSVSRMRPSQTLHPPSAWSQLDSETKSYTIWDFLVNFSEVIPGRKGLPSPFSNYFVNPAAPYDEDPVLVYPSIFNLTTPSAFADTFAQLLNTYYLASIGSRSVAVSGSTRFDRLTRERQFNGTIERTVGIYSLDEPVLTCNQKWLAVLIVADLIPLAATILIMTLESRRRGPALSMNISTLLRESAHSGLPSDAGSLADADRSRASRNVKVRLGDIQSQNDVGRIAIGRADKVSRLSRRRRYI